MEFCHRVAAGVFESLYQFGYRDVETAVMGVYLDLAESVGDPDELCLCLLESRAASWTADSPPPRPPASSWGSPHDSRQPIPVSIRSFDAGDARPGWSALGVHLPHGGGRPRRRVAIDGPLGAAYSRWRFGPGFQVLPSRTTRS
ncbi:DUF7551 domain-containing protein [Haloarcula halobia]|uniref:DUF7551 domain-containing protein n=1 Tax=Haloarcula halobia TaxID=3033388 RepID=UPI003AF32BD2